MFELGRERRKPIYMDYRRLIAACPDGPLLDIGGGTAHVKKVRPEVLSVDILPVPGIDLVPRYSACRFLSRLDVVPPSLRRTAGAAMAHLPAPLKSRYERRLNALAGLLSGAETRPGQRYAFMITYFMDYQKREGYADAMESFLDGSALDKLNAYFGQAPNLAPTGPIFTPICRTT
jgi:hypothetical protein